MSNSIVGYKCFDKDLKCRGFSFDVGKTYKHKGKIELCNSGFHFHHEPKDIFTYYEDNILKTRVCEIKAKNYYISTDKAVCGEISILRELSGSEIKMLYDDCGYGDGDGNDNGYGSGDGSGHANGSGSGDGDGYGSGDGSGSGDGYGYGYGYGDGDGDGYGDGYGYSSGDGSGSGYGYGYGDGDGYGSGDGSLKYKDNF